MLRPYLAAVALAATPVSALAWSTEYDATADTFTGTHQWITVKAIQYLDERGLWDPGMDPNLARRLVQYGVHWADEPWMGPPDDPTAQVTTARDRYPLPASDCGTPGEPVPPIDCPPIQIIEDDQDCHAVLGDFETLCGRARMLWLGRTTNAPNWFLSVEFGLEAFGVEHASEWQMSAADNLFHYAFDPVVDTVRLYPFNHPDLSDEEQAHLRNMSIYTDMSIGVGNYGPILYQLARKFADRSWFEPDSGELPFVKYVYQGDPLHNGRVHADDPLYDDINIYLPPTYLGGMPFMCAGGSEQMLQCDPNTPPTWPFWATSDWEVSTPGRSTMASWVYAGWAAHMMQDATMPHHATGYTGEVHKALDSAPDWLAGASSVTVCDEGDTYMAFPAPDYEPEEWRCYSGTAPSYMPHPRPIDEYFQHGLDALFGAAGSPRFRREICADIGIVDDQNTHDGLNWETVAPVFAAEVEASRASLEWAIHPGFDGRDGGYLPRVQSAIRATMKLLACAQPHSLSPALTMTVVSNLI